MRPIPTKFGIGFTCDEPLPEGEALGYRYEKVGIYHNYYATAENWSFPLKEDKTKAINFKIDGFSPNLNKSLHVGHLRNLAIANSLCKMLDVYNSVAYPNGKSTFVALLGASLGVKKEALDGWKYWTDFVQYHPKEYFDITLPNDVVETHPATPVDATEYSNAVAANTEAWDGPKGEVIVKRSTGVPLYAYYDLAFASYVGPTHYITGHEQKEHFEQLGFGEKHLAMGLVLGEDGKKLKSRTGDAILAKDILQMITERLDGNDEKLAWNILAWNFLHVNREKDLKFNLKDWTNPDQGGLYITYTYARALSALKQIPYRVKKLYREQLVTPLQDEDIALLGFAEQYKYYLQLSMYKLDPTPLANFTYELAKQISQAYTREKVQGGRRSFIQSFEHATWRLENCLLKLGMFAIQKV